MADKLEGVGRSILELRGMNPPTGADVGQKVARKLRKARRTVQNVQRDIEQGERRLVRTIADIDAAVSNAASQIVGTNQVRDDAITTAKIADNAVTLSKLVDIESSRIIGRTTGAVGDLEVLTPTQVTALLDVFTSSLKGLVPSSGGGTTNYLRADGTWAAPAGSGVSSTSAAETSADSVNNTEANILEIGPITVASGQKVCLLGFCEVVKDSGTTSRLATLRLRRHTGTPVTSGSVLVGECRAQLVGVANAPAATAISIVDNPGAGTYYYALLGSNGAFTLTYQDKSLVALLVV